MSFSASYDRTTKIVSTLVCLGLLAVIFAVQHIILTCLSILVILLSFAYSPRGYSLEAGSIVVRRLAGAARIPLNDVHEARRATPDDFRGCIRLGGSGGLFGYYGLFSTATLGKSTWYVTNRSHSVVVITGSKTVLISPDEPDQFLATLRTYAPISSASVPFSSRSMRSFSAVGKVVAIAAALVGMVAGIVAFSYSPGVPRYTLTHETLTIHDRFYPVTLSASGVDVNRIRVVDLAADPDWRPTLRTNGFANSHYQSGWFRVAGGEKVRLYRAGGQRLVLLPPNTAANAPVLCQADDPDAFAFAVRAAWSAPTSAQ
jgi:Bacterial PH domain